MKYIPDHFAMKTIHAAKWSLISELFAKSFVPILFIILVRYLGPEDFGVISAATLMISFSQHFCEMGLNRAVIQRETHIEQTLNIVFWSTFGLSLLIYVSLFIFAEMISGLFQDSRLIWVIRVQGIQLVFLSICSVYIALFQREMNFKTLFHMRIITRMLPSVVAVLLAWYGFRYWSLVISVTAGAIIQYIVLLILSPWRPCLTFDMDVAKEIFSFGIWVTGGAVLVWSYGQVDALIVGTRLNMHDFGLYQTGNTLVTLVFTAIFNPLMPVMFSSMSRLQNDIEKLRETLLKAVGMIAFIALPAGGGIYIISDLIAAVLFRNEWTGIGSVVAFMSATQAFSWLLIPCNEAYRATGKAHIETWLYFIIIIVYLPVYFSAAQYGLWFFLKVRLAAACLIGVPIQLFMVNKYLAISPLSILKHIYKIILAFVVFFALTFSFQQTVQFENPWLNLSLVIIVGIVIYTSAIYVLDKRYFDIITLLFKKKVPC